MKLALRLSMALLLFSAAPALASLSGGRRADATAAASADPAQKPTTRQEAERWYHEAYGDVEKAKTALEAKKSGEAEKKLRRAIERAEKATALDTTYHEAWNLVGYAHRKLKEYDRAVAAYQRCLGLEPEYGPALEYLGEAYLEMGKLDQAKLQLGAIDAVDWAEEARTLSAAIAAYEKAHSAPMAGGETGNGEKKEPAAAAGAEKK